MATDTYCEGKRWAKKKKIKSTRFENQFRKLSVHLRSSTIWNNVSTKMKSSSYSYWRQVPSSIRVINYRFILFSVGSCNFIEKSPRAARSGSKCSNRMVPLFPLILVCPCGVIQFLCEVTFHISHYCLCRIRRVRIKACFS